VAAGTWRRAESAVGRVETFPPALGRQPGSPPRRRLCPRRSRPLAQVLGEGGRLLGERVRCPSQARRSASTGWRSPVDRVDRWRKIGSSKERPLVRREEDGPWATRPGAVCGQRGGHVDVVEIGPLLPVHLEYSRRAIHQGGDGSSSNDSAPSLAPVAGRVADAEEDRCVLRLGSGQRSFSPRVPVTGVGVLRRYGLVSRSGGWCAGGIG